MSQNQSYADSLEVVYRNGSFDEGDRLTILSDLVINQNDPDKIIEFSDELIEQSKKSGELSFTINAYIGKGQALRLKGDLPEALQNFYKANAIAIKLDDPIQVGLNELNIADVQQVMGNYQSSINNYRSSISKFREVKDSMKIAFSLINLGDTYNLLQKPDSALIYLNEAERIMNLLRSEKGLAYSWGNMGISFALKGRNQEYETYLQKAVSILQKLGDSYGVSAYLNYLSDLYLERGEYANALFYSKQSLEIANDFGLKKQVSDASLRISEIYEALGDTITSYRYFKDHIAYKDSVTNFESLQKMADVRTDFEVSQKQLEVDLLNTQKRTQRIIMYSLGLFLMLTFFYYRRIVKEKNRSDLLLLNILPSKTAKELKEKGKVEARKFKAATVMFTDFQAFTRHSQNLSPEKLVKSVDHFFSAFDRIIEKYGLEKIKTIGDAYMCAGGLISTGPLQPVKVILAAFEILNFVQKESESDNDEIAHFNIRIGINTGPVVGGVVGTKKFAYDIWGDTVNVAARMETNSQAGMINISENTYQFVKDQFECEYRGEIDVKNKGMMNMYFVLGPHMSLNNAEIEAAELYQVRSALDKL
ncbi:MAG: adenylate/guanylate cyclase domain-containing protein [Lutimonas sp.]